MSWEHDKYEATCDHCGHKGFVTHSSDDWGRSEISYEGFQNIEPSATAVGRKRASARDHSPRCACGSTSITRGAYVSSS